ncbi:hypothetical protein [Halomonas halocynthiae]|uniref:hypothetical protein n=1 Tax=Halomonas halocynthiae TaxID=176290 RepID=UPI0004039F32|nr:hypothetical protein [Halomonas halocynthiae]
MKTGAGVQDVMASVESGSKEAWLEARLAKESVERRAVGIVAGLDIQSIAAVGFPYLLLEYCWEVRRWGRCRSERMACLVDRCQGVSTTLEGIAFGDALLSPLLPHAELEPEPLERKARQHVMQVRRHRLKRRSSSGLTLVSAQLVRKPLWRVVGNHGQHGELELLIDGVNGGYYLM